LTKLALTALGASSNVTICAPAGLSGSTNGCDNGTTKLSGQTITLGTGTFGTPVIVSAGSTLSQNVAAGTTTGVTDATKAQFRFTSTNGNATITELGFKDTVAGGALTAVRVGSTTAPAASNKAFMTGLNISVPSGGTGATVDAFASYSPVGSQGLATTTTDDITSLLKLSYVKYTIGGTTSTLCANGDAPGSGNCTATTAMPVSSAQTMYIVGSKPTVTVAQPSGVTLAVGNVEAIDVTITADNAGPVSITSFPITSSLSAGAGSPTYSTATAFVVKDKDNNTVSLFTNSGTTNQYSSSAGGAATIKFDAPYLLNAGQSQTFKVFLPVAALGTGTLPNTYMYTKVTTGVIWADTAGGAAAATDSGQIYNYPTTFTSSIHN